MPPTTSPESAVLGDTEEAAHLDQAPGALLHPSSDNGPVPGVGEEFVGHGSAMSICLAAVRVLRAVPI
jgi:hypothetical protein